MKISARVRNSRDHHETQFRIAEINKEPDEGVSVAFV
jgi:hypothetical protein